MLAVVSRADDLLAALPRIADGAEEKGITLPVLESIDSPFKASVGGPSLPDFHWLRARIAAAERQKQSWDQEEGFTRADHLPLLDQDRFGLNRPEA